MRYAYNLSVHQVSFIRPGTDESGTGSNLTRIGCLEGQVQLDLSCMNLNFANRLRVCSQWWPTMEYLPNMALGEREKIRPRCFIIPVHSYLLLSESFKMVNRFSSTSFWSGTFYPAHDYPINRSKLRSGNLSHDLASAHKKAWSMGCSIRAIVRAFAEIVGSISFFQVLANKWNEPFHITCYFIFEIIWSNYWTNLVSFTIYCFCISY